MMNLKRTASMLGFSTALLFAFLSGCNAESRHTGTKSSVQGTRLGSGVLANLRREHPRLLFTRGDQRRIEKLAKKDPLLADMIAQLTGHAEWLLAKPVIEYKLAGTPTPRIPQNNMLRQSRACVVRIATLAMAYRLTGDRRFAERGRQELLTAAALEDWNPYHFLDTAEMSCAVAIGYDWLYDVLSKADRAKIRNAIVTKALKPGIEAYLKQWGWTRRNNNWNQVCNGGLVLGALAVAEDEPCVATEIITNALHSIRKGGLTAYRPDGAWFEGPAYWTYGTTYNAMLIAALDSAFGDDFGLSRAEGLNKTGFFRVHMVRPGGKAYFNYADCLPECGISPVSFWLARKFNNPALAWFERQLLQREFASYREHKEEKEYLFAPTAGGHFYTLGIVWFDERSKMPGGGKLPLDACFRGKVDVAVMRSAWDDEQALYVGFKGGDNTVGHGHLDIGSFILDAGGLAWAIDLGYENYSLPGYWKAGENGQRWSYYRLGSKSHNTLVIGDKLQRVGNSTSKVIDFHSTPNRAYGVVDMSRAYGGQAKKVLRGIAMLDRKAVLVQDEITCLDNAVIRWGMVTPAKIKLEGARAILTQKGQAFSAEILSPAGARFEIVSTAAPTRLENPNTGTSMLAVFVKPGDKKNVRLAVLLKPISDRGEKPLPPELRPLMQWKNQVKPVVTQSEAKKVAGSGTILREGLLK